MEKAKIEEKNNFAETDTLSLTKTLLENIPNEEKLEKYFDDVFSIPESNLKRIEELGGDKGLLRERLKPVMEKMEALTAKIRSRVRVLTYAVGATLFAQGLVQSSELHHPVESSKDDPQMVEERAGAYVQGKSEWFAEHIHPFGYALVGIDKVIVDNIIGRLAYSNKETVGDRYDAWYLYLGLEQEHGTFEVSPYKPSVSKDTGKVYYRMPEKEEFILRNALLELTESGKDKMELRDNTHRWDTKGKDSLARYIPKGYGGIMGRYTVSKGEDEKGHYISYYDEWDLKLGGVFGDKEAHEMAGVGKPFEIYGRIYYDPKTGNPLK